MFSFYYLQITARLKWSANWILYWRMHCIPNFWKVFLCLMHVQACTWIIYRSQWHCCNWPSLKKKEKTQQLHKCLAYHVNHSVFVKWFQVLSEVNTTSYFPPYFLSFSLPSPLPAYFYCIPNYRPLEDSNLDQQGPTCLLLYAFNVNDWV